MIAPEEDLTSCLKVEVDKIWDFHFAWLIMDLSSALKVKELQILEFYLGCLWCT